MGARPYDPSLGRFLAVDPVDGGSANNYDYAGQDPVNGYDLDGTCWQNYEANADYAGAETDKCRLINQLYDLCTSRHLNKGHSWDCWDYAGQHIRDDFNIPDPWNNPYAAKSSSISWSTSRCLDAAVGYSAIKNGIIDFISGKMSVGDLIALGTKEGAKKFVIAAGLSCVAAGAHVH
jgi:hypothetical protein